MRLILSILLIFGLTACTGTKEHDEQKPKEPLPEEIEPEENDQEEKSEDTTGKGNEQSQDDVMSNIQDQILAGFEIKLPKQIENLAGNFLSAIVLSEKDYYEVTFIKSAQPLELNDEQLFDEEALLIVRGKRYASQDEAFEAVNYQPIQDGMPEIDLGYSITGYEDAGAGSAFITWHEGRWSFMMRSRNTEEGNAAGEQLSKDIVEKLEEQLLPPPHEYGAGLFSSASDASVDTNRIAWQEDHIVYEVYGADPLQLIDVVTENFSE